MKNYIYYAFIVVLTISCNHIDELEIENNTSDFPKALYAKISNAESRAINVYQPIGWNEEEDENIESRTYAKFEDDSYTQYWSIGDEISYFETTQNSKYKRINNGMDQTIDKFELASSAIQKEPLASGYFYSVYPYKTDTSIEPNGRITYTFPGTQDYCVDSYANGANGMIARHQNPNEDLDFLNFCSYLQLQLSSTMSKKVDKIVLKANDESNLMAGIGTIVFNDETNEPEVTMKPEFSTNEITLNCKNTEVFLSTEPTKFWFVLPGGFTFTNGFNVTILFSDGTYYKRTTKRNIEPILRNHIRPMSTLSIDNIPNGTIRYKYEDPQYNSIEYAFPFNQCQGGFTDEAGNPLTYETTFDETTQEFVVTFTNGTLKNINSNTFILKDDASVIAPNIDYIIINNSESINLNEHSFYLCSAETIDIFNDVDEINKESFGESDINDLNFYRNITTIKRGAFNSSTIESLKVEGHVTSIAQRAAANSSINRLEINSVETIGSNAFTGSDIEIITVKNITEIQESAFSYCENLKTLRVTNIEEIGDYAFEGSTIQYLNIESTVSKIGEGAFQDCNDLTTVNIFSVENIGTSAFEGCNILNQVNLYSVEVIGYSAFKTCNKLEYVSIGNNCSEINEGAFTGCSPNLTVYLYAQTPPTLKHKNGQTGNPFIFPDRASIYVPIVEAYDTNSYWYYYSSNNNRDQLKLIPSV